MNFNTILGKLLSKQHLAEEEITFAMQAIMNAEWSPILVAAFLTAFAGKGETADEIAACVNIMREKAVPVTIKNPLSLDNCGTGGDGLHTVNISTMAAMVLASGGVPVVKHGNKSVSSSCGSADILHELGINIHVSAKGAESIFEIAGITFLFAPLFHPAMKSVMPVRKELGVRTVFNMLGPLSNPASVKRQIIGVYKPELLTLYSEIILKLPIDKACIVHGSNGMDEISIEGETRINFVSQEGGIQGFIVSPADFGLKEQSVEQVKGGDAKFNAVRVDRLLSGEENAIFDTVCMNASLGFQLANKVQNLKEGVELSRTLLKEGKTRTLVDNWKKASFSVQ